jgi:lipoate-protein ligase A
MVVPVCRLLPFGVADGPHNMAADEVLLEAAACGMTSLRFYGWSEATLSLGYFQSERVRHADAALARLPYVRRPTGGATLVHHHELTYALGLPAGAPWQNGEPWLRRMHAIIASALSKLQVTTHMQAVTSKEPSAGILCFQHVTAGDLLSGSAKIVGSAQRRKRGTLLQHGAILLARSPYAPVLLGIQELSGHALSTEQVAAAVVRRFAGETGWQMVPEDWSAAERQRIERLVGERFTRDSWNRKR